MWGIKITLYTLGGITLMLRCRNKSPAPNPQAINNDRSVDLYYLLDDLSGCDVHLWHFAFNAQNSLHSRMIDVISQGH